MMNKISANMKDIVVVYINDLLIFMKTNDQDEHDRLVCEVLQRLEENNLLVNPEKCFLIKGVEFSAWLLCWWNQNGW